MTTSNEKTFKPAEAAATLEISVATLRKYSLIVEKVTGNADYYERNSQKNRLYTQKNIDDFVELVKESHQPKTTLETAAKKVYNVSDDVAATPKTKKAPAAKAATKKTTATPKKKSESELQTQVDKLKKENKKLKEDYDKLKNTAAKDIADDVKYEEYVQQLKEIDRPDNTNATQEDADASKSNHLKTLVNMQVPDEKKDHWWNRFIR